MLTKEVNFYKEAPEKKFSQDIQEGTVEISIYFSTGVGQTAYLQRTSLSAFESNLVNNLLPFLLTIP